MTTASARDESASFGHGRTDEDRTALATGDHDEQDELYGYSRNGFGRQQMVTGGQVHCPRPEMAGRRSTVPQSAAFSFMSEHPADVRPVLLELSAAAYRRTSDAQELGDQLALVARQNAVELRSVTRYFANYLAAYCERVGMKVKENVRNRIVCDAVRDWLFEHFAPNQEEQAKSMKMRKENFARLSGIVHKALRKRLAEAHRRYVAAVAGTEFEAIRVKWMYGEKNAAGPQSVALSPEVSDEQSPIEHVEVLSQAPEEALSLRGFKHVFIPQAGSPPVRACASAFVG